MRHFITSSGTEIGKTFVTSLLVRQSKGTLSACKPVLSGFDDTSPETSDTAQLLAAQNLPLSPENIAAHSPYRFTAPLSPHMAAAREGRHIPLDSLVAWCAGRPENDLIEGVGGAMVPLNDTHTVLDWMQALNAPAIMVVGSYLGSISHSLTAAAMIHNAGLPLQAVIVSESVDSAVPLDDTVTTLRQFIPYARHIATLPRVNAWHEAPNLLYVLS